MLSLVILVVAAYIPILEIHGDKGSNFDINAILDIIRTQQKIAKTNNNKFVSSSESSESVEDEAFLRSKQLIRLLHQTLENVHKTESTDRENLQQYNNVYEIDFDKNKEDFTYEDNKFVIPLEQFAENLSDKRQPKSPDKVTKHRLLKPGSLLKPYIEHKNDVADGLNQYSSIYVILNSEAYRSSQNKKQLTDLISRLLANSAPASQNADHSLNEMRYNGFPVRGGLSQRRSRRDSAEVALVPINESYGEPVLNLDDLLNALESLQKKERDLQSDSSSSSDTSDTSDDDKDLALRGTKLVSFLQQARDKQNNKKLAENKRLSNLYSHLTYLDNDESSKNKDLGGDYVDMDSNRKNHVDDFVQYLLSQINKKSNTKDKSARLKSRDDYLLSLNNKNLQKEDIVTKLSNDVDGEDGNLQDYSRIYVILNPEALKSNQNKKDLSSLISRLMSKSSTVKQSRMSPKQLQYKRLPVKGLYAQRRSAQRRSAQRRSAQRQLAQRLPVQRRSRRDSLEGGRDSLEDKYNKPRRPRYNSYYGGGGGVAGGRTPIPYIRHHGDIYERNE